MIAAPNTMKSYPSPRWPRTVREYSDSKTMNTAPSAGPQTVARPPMSAITTTSREIRAVITL